MSAQGIEKLLHALAENRGYNVVPKSEEKK